MKNPLHAVSIVTTNHIVGGILFSLPFIIKTLSEDFQIIIDQNQVIRFLFFVSNVSNFFLDEFNFFHYLCYFNFLYSFGS